MANNVDGGISAETSSFMKIFGGAFIYRVPVFQRPYVWAKSSVKRLFDNISEIEYDKNAKDAGESHFIGSMFVSIKSNPSPNNPGEYWIIDGQQRTTTMYLTLLSLLLEVRAAEKKFGADDEMKANFKKLVNRINKHLFYQSDSGSLIPKFYTGLKDSHQMFNILKDTETESLEYPPDKGIMADSQLADSQKVLRKCVHDAVTDENDRFSYDLADALIQKLLGQTKIVFITLTEKEDPGVVFNTLNSTAAPLATIDLVRNDIFGRIGDDPQFTRAEQLYETRWSPLEKRFPSQDEFNNFLFPYVLLYRPQRAKKRMLMPTLKDIWSTDMQRGAPREWTPAEIISDLERFVPFYLAFNDSCAKSEAESLGASLNPLLAEAVWRIRRMGCPTPIYPYLFKLFDAAIRNDGVTEEQLKECVEIIESLVVRRFFSGIEPTGLHAIFKDLWGKHGADAEALRPHLWRVANCPSDITFRAEIHKRPIYRSVSNIPMFVMMEYEKSLSGIGDPLEGLLDQDGRSAVTIDHVMPQKADEAWRVQVPDFEQVLDTWANLAPMSLSANAQKGASAWREAREMIRQGTRFHSTRKIAENPNWGSAEIRARADLLADWALKRWPHGPKE